MKGKEEMNGLGVLPCDLNLRGAWSYLCIHPSMHVIIDT
jgi:hypothetical protein